MLQILAQWGLPTVEELVLRVNFFTVRHQVGAYSNNKRSTLKHILIELRRSERKGNCRGTKQDARYSEDNFKESYLLRNLQEGVEKFMDVRKGEERGVSRTSDITNTPFLPLSGQGTLWILSANNMSSILFNMGFLLSQFLTV